MIRLRTLQFWVALLIMGFCVSALALMPGCGNGSNVSSSASGLTSNPNQGPIQSTCPSGQVPIAGTCVSQADSFDARCRAAYGQMSSVSGTSICRVDRAIPFPGVAYLGLDTPVDPLPRLTKSVPNAFTALNTALVVQVGDVLTYNGSGKWGTSTDCDTNINTGSKSGSIVMNDGLPSGLLASDGADVWHLGQTPTKVINHIGTLKLGFNAQPTVMKLGCVRFNTYELKLTHCEDANATTYTCP